MILDFDMPWMEFRFRLQLLCAARWEIWKLIQIDLKIPWISWKMIMYNGFSISPLIYWHWTLIEIGKMPRQGCYKLLLFNKIIRNYYDGYPIEENNGQKASIENPAG